MNLIYEAWSDDDGVMFTTKEKIVEFQKLGILSEDAFLLHTIVADSHESAMQQHHNAMGWEEYIPIDK